MADSHGEDFQEEEVWATQFTNSKPKTRENSSSSSSYTSRYAATSSGGGTAPIRVPEWSKIMKGKPKRNPWDDGHDDDDDGSEQRKLRRNYSNSDDDDDDDKMVPPHEYLARRVASSQIASFSMCEGVGRTLKGRDLSKLRNAILTKTGFLE